MIDPNAPSFDFSYAEVNFMCYPKQGPVLLVKRTAFTNDVPWVAQQLLEVNGYTKVTYELNGTTHTVTK